MEIRRHETTLQSAMHHGLWQGEVVRLALGRGPDKINTVSTASLGLARVRFPHEATVITQQPREFVTFTLPLTYGRKLRVNGAAGPSHGLFVNFGCRETHIYGLGRDHIAGRIETTTLLSVLSRMTGSSLQEDAVPCGVVSLTPLAHKQLVQSLLASIHDNNAKAEDACLFEQQIVHKIASALISACQLNDRAKKALQIVKRACNKLESSKNKQPSLAEMCDAAGFSAPVVTSAFRRITGASPARYVRLMRLARAHDELCKGDPMTASVKAIALETGFSELGRFSGLYKQVYGTLPSNSLWLNN